jgi:alkanesulfonate monooxygenase SsuD/methylene tetrahydromethanopterin reductase-like flavin-dependent oxidoreductase (luciferase family)
VLKRIAEHCDGWLPVFENDRMAFGGASGRTAAAALAESRSKLRQFAEAAGRDKQRFEIAVILTPESDPASIRVIEDAGADRVALTLPEVNSIDDARRALDAMATKVFRVS